jgi:hypothetical protein
MVSYQAHAHCVMGFKVGGVDKDSIAVAAFVLSVLALVWNLGLTWVRWPRVGVDVRLEELTTWRDDVVVDYDVRVRVIVVNRGSEAITVRNIGLVDVGPGDPEGEGRVLADVNYVGLSRVGHPVPAGNELPARLDGRDCLVWVYSPDLLLSYRRYGSEVKAYAEIYRSVWWPGQKLETRRVLSGQVSKFPASSDTGL